MVRNYVRKSNRGHYTPDAMQEVLEVVKAGHMNASKACRIYNIPLSTIMCRLKGRRGIKSTTFGRGTVLSPNDEKRLADGLRTLDRSGFKLSKKEVLDIAGQFINCNQIQTPFKNGNPGEDWLRGFKKRNHLFLKKAQSLEVTKKKSCNPANLNEYLHLLEATMKSLSIVNCSTQIWSLDEVSFCMDLSNCKTENGSGATSSGQMGKSFKVLIAASASGKKIPPLIIFKGKSVWNQWSAPENTGFLETSYAATEHGGIDPNIFENNFEHNFLKQAGRQRPLLIIYNGSYSLLTIRFLELASAANVSIVKLPLFTSHLLHPLELSVLASLKSIWKEELLMWQNANNGEKLPKSECSRIIGEIWRDLDPIVIITGFKLAGICPFSRDVIPGYKRSQPASLNHWIGTKTILTNTLNDYQNEQSLSMYQKGNSALDPLSPMEIPNQETLKVAIKQDCSSSTENSPFVTPNASPYRTSTFENGFNDCLVKNSNKRILFPEMGMAYAHTTIERNGNDFTGINEVQSNLCTICKCNFRFYINNQKWTRCITCRQWVCGICNGGSPREAYECDRCADDDS